MAQSPAFQFYAQDFFMGTLSMSAAARGCYISMLAASWTSGGSIENTPNAIAKAMSWGPSDPPFADLWAEVQTKWKLGTSGWTNERLEAIRREQEAYRLRQSERGKLGGRPVKAKAGSKPEETHGLTVAYQNTANANPEPKRQESPSPSPLTFDLDLRSSASPSVKAEVQTNTEVQREKAAPRLIEFETVAKHLQAAAYAHLAEFPDCSDGDLADAVKDAAAKLHVYDYTGRKVTAIVNHCRGYLAKAEREAVVSA